MSKSTATVTWISYRNFGTWLQAYALQETLRSHGFSNRIIDDGKVVGNFAKKRFSPVRFIRNIGWLNPGLSAFRSRSACVESEYGMFRKKYLEIDGQWDEREELAHRYDVYIAGSDQIWSPNVPFDDFYFLKFAQGRKISYAPSFGTASIPDRFMETVGPLLRDFYGMTVREPAGARALKEKLGMDVPVVADPTMLLTASDWDGLLADAGYDAAPSGHGYALCYLLTYNPDYISYVKDYCRRKGLELKMIVLDKRMMGIADVDLYAGPFSFVDAVRKADVVFTDSFHGSVFSLLYGREFLIFRRFPSSDASGQNSRVEHLMNLVGLESRLTGYGCADEGWEADKIDYMKVNQAVDSFRRFSLDCLLSMLEEGDEGDM